MKHLLFLLTTTLLTGCHQYSYNKKPDVTLKSFEDSSNLYKREYFVKHIASRNCNDGSCKGDTTTDFKVFMRLFFPHTNAINVDDPLIYALEEPYIDSLDVINKLDWVRFTIDDTWSIPYCIVATSQNNRTYITFKITDGSGGYYPGVLWASETVSLGDSIYKSVDTVLSKANFWNLPHNMTNYCVTDGTQITVESIKNGKYNLVEIYSPYSCGNKEAKLLDSLNFFLQSFIDVRRIYHRVSNERSDG